MGEMEVINMYKNSVVHYITKIVVDIMLYVGIACVIAVPFFCEGLLTAWGYTPISSVLFTLVLFLSGVCSVYILYILKKMFKTLLGGNPFVEENIKSFRKMAFSCAIITLLYVFKAMWIFTWATVVIALVFLVGTLFCLTLKDLFKQAVYYKEENDWTV